MHGLQLTSRKTVILMHGTAAEIEPGRGMTDRELMRIRVETLFTRDAAGRLLRVNKPQGNDAPRFFLGRTAEGSDCWFRVDVDDHLARWLAAAAKVRRSGEDHRLAPEDPAAYVALLERAAPIQRTKAGPAYCFPRELAELADVVPVTNQNAEILRPHLEPWLDSTAAGLLTMAVVEGGRAVAVCNSARITDVAHEAGVETAPGFRGRGHAARAVASWAVAVRRAGAIPLYSTSWSNTASQAVARKLGLRMFGADLHII
jgi:RimJ/RimL family protein N-acetyltransferase